MVAERMGVKEERLGPDTRLAEDVGMDGDDAGEFLDAFRDEFGVDMAGFDFDLYFGGEGFFPPLYLYWLLFDRRKLRSIPVTLADLAASAEAKKWIPPAAP